MKYFYNSPNKPVAVYHESRNKIIDLAKAEKCEIVIRDNTGAGIQIVNKKPNK